MAWDACCGPWCLASKLTPGRPCAAQITAQILAQNVTCEVDRHTFLKVLCAGPIPDLMIKSFLTMPRKTPPEWPCYTDPSCVVSSTSLSTRASAVSQSSSIDHRETVQVRRTLHVDSCRSSLGFWLTALALAERGLRKPRKTDQYSKALQVALCTAYVSTRPMFIVQGAQAGPSGCTIGTIIEHRETLRVRRTLLADTCRSSH
jgi:hypothetical protein